MLVFLYLTVRITERNQENKLISSQLSETRLQAERLDYDNKESAITIDNLKEQNADAVREIEDLRKTVTDLRLNQKDASAEQKEKKN